MALIQIQIADGLDTILEQKNIILRQNSDISVLQKQVEVSIFEIKKTLGGLSRTLAEVIRWENGRQEISKRLKLKTTGDLQIRICDCKAKLQEHLNKGQEYQSRFGNLEEGDKHKLIIWFEKYFDTVIESFELHEEHEIFEILNNCHIYFYWIRSLCINSATDHYKVWEEFEWHHSNRKKSADLLFNWVEKRLSITDGGLRKKIRNLLDKLDLHSYNLRGYYIYKILNNSNVKIPRKERKVFEESQVKQDTIDITKETDEIWCKLCTIFNYTNIHVVGIQDQEVGSTWEHFVNLEKRFELKKDDALTIIAMDSFTKEFPCQVPNCKKILGSKKSLKDHLSRTHCKNNKIKCKICNDDFKHQQTFNRHMETQHSEIVGGGGNNKKRKCGTCNNIYNSQSVLTTHQKRHPGHSGVLTVTNDECHVRIIASSGSHPKRRKLSIRQLQHGNNFGSENSRNDDTDASNLDLREPPTPAFQDLVGHDNFVNSFDGLDFNEAFFE